MRQQNFYAIVLILSFLLTGCCGQISSKTPHKEAECIATKAHFNKVIVATDPFLFTTYQKLEKSQPRLIIYIEGDGHSWINRHTVSKDPTPHNPLALKLAALDLRKNIVYLARPCQYTDHEVDTACHPAVWTSHRYSKKIISAMNEAVEKLKKEAKAKEIELIGFSGGAAIAVLIAAGRLDVVNLKTIAGDLDHEKMTNYHQTTPLQDALNPRHFAQNIAHIPQCHYIGKKDPIVPEFISEDFLQTIRNTHPENANKMILSQVSHHKGWEEVWPKCLSKTTEKEKETEQEQKQEKEKT